MILAVVLGLAWKARVEWPAVPLADGDTWGYLRPALTWLSGAGFQQTEGRDWPYPAMLALFLKMTGSFSGIVEGQRFLGMLSGIFMAITWRCWVSMLPVQRWVRFVASCLGVVPIYVQLVNQESIFLEVSIRPEAVLPCFVYGQLACLMGYCKYRWQTPRALPTLLLGGAAIVLACGCALLKPSWYFSAAATVAPVFAGCFGHALSRRIRLVTPALGMAAAVLFLSLPARAWFIRDQTSGTFLAINIFGVHAEFIERYFEAKLAVLPDADPDKARLRSLQEVLKSEIHTAGHTGKVYEKLGFNPDYLMHSPIMGEALNRYTGNDRKKFSSFCLQSYRNAVLYDPAGYTRKVLDQFAYFVFPEPKTFFLDQFNVKKEYWTAATVLYPDRITELRPEVQEMYRAYGEEVKARSGTAMVLESYPKLSALRTVVSRCTPSGELLFLIALAVSLAWGPLHKLRLAGWAAFLLFLAPAQNAFEISIIHALDIFRYRMTYGGYLLFALTAMAVFICLVVAQTLDHWVASRRARRAA
ncbi:MAG: hypothetical protein ABJF10_12530 [Chthoniobacter sp.]|uniref:hypothetical protein n=1 Tax=Chthoniobacter sp. TaxID=2510640 RepID=UPI0032AA50DD